MPDSTLSDPPDSMKFHFITAVWGESYVDLFLDICLPNQLTKGNLLAFANDKGSVYKLYTRKEDERRLRSSKLLKQVEDIMPVRISVLNDLHVSSDHQTAKEHAFVIESMNRCHIAAVKEGNAVGAALFFLTPDSIWSEGSFSRARELIFSGKRVVGVAGARLTKETFIPVYMDKLKQLNDSSTTLNSRELVSTALPHLHPIIKSLCVDSKTFAWPWAFYIFWNLGENGLVVKTMHLHPLAVAPKDKTVEPSVSVDGYYLTNACPDYDDYHVVTDSDEITVFELSAENKMSEFIRPGRFSPHRYASFIKSGSDKFNRKFLRHNIIFHPDGITDELLKVACESERIVRKSLSLCGIKEYFERDSRPLSVLEHVRKIVIFGTGAGCKRAMRLASLCGWDVSYLVDNHQAKWGAEENGFQIKSPDALNKRDFDIIVVASVPGKTDIFKQLDDMGFAYGEGYIFFFDKIRIKDFEIKMNSRENEALGAG